MQSISSFGAARFLLALFLSVGYYNVVLASTFVVNRPQVPNLKLISGCKGTGKSTFGMECAIQKGILKCISTDTIRQTLRSVITDKEAPALHRSSFAGSGDPIIEWHETCSAVEKSVESIVLDCLHRGTSLVLEGVHIVPSNALIDKWTSAGGFAVGAVLTIPDQELHREVIFRRGEQTGKGAEAQTTQFSRIRAIHDEMVRLGSLTDWVLVEQQPTFVSPVLTLNEFIQSRCVLVAALPPLVV